MHAQHADDAELDRPDDLEFFKGFDWSRVDYKAWALIPAIVFGATVVNAFVLGWIAWDWLRGKGARHPGSVAVEEAAE